ncbi:anthranilate phosphoribosyltransferase [Euzebya tangerina]|uniref:anthranilate phosphoribosyltransferase n=1 Tax=Euzebya tangerina TaxID=591198 RepID=UPI000E30F3A2|nr:anthranilate phosphoribosyltransferase [Euzebya tangerina]
MTIPEVLSTLLAGEDLDDSSTHGVMEAIMRGDVTPAQVAGFTMGLRMKGETAEEIAGLVSAMRSFALPVSVEGPLVDTCGTGGDRAGTFNVSTLAALVTAGAGAKVAKHGNRAASGKCGSADLLEAWGVVIDLPPDGVERCIEEVGIGFCFAPMFHPAMRHVMPARRELGVPTVFNFLGPLTNPAGAGHQTIGVSDPAMAPKMAGVLARLGSVHALVFHGSDGLDELTTTGPSTIWEVREGSVESYDFDPAEHGVARATVEDLKGGDLEDNLRIADAVLEGQAGAPRDVVVLGAAAALMAVDRAGSWEEALGLAAESLDSGAARGVRDSWVTLSKSLA